MHEIIVHIDAHHDVASIKALIELLSTYKKQDVTLFFMELPSSLNNIDVTEKVIKQIVECIELFPQGILTDSRLNPEQLKFIEINNIDKETINRYVTNEKKNYLTHKYFLDLLKILRALKIQLINIDLPVGIDKSMNAAGELENRNKYMAQQITNAFEGRNDTKAILYTGASHCYNVWGLGAYNRSLLTFLRQNKIKIRNPMIFVYSLDDEIIQRYRRDLDQCHPSIKFAFREFKVGRNQEHMGNVKDFIEGNATSQQFLATEGNKDKENQNEYWILNPSAKQTSEGMQRYLIDLGATIKRCSSAIIIFVINSDYLKKEIRELVGLDRVAIEPLSPQGETYLRDNLPGITIEKIKKENNKLKWLLTFVDDRKTKNPQNRNFIDHAIQQFSFDKSSLTSTTSCKP